MMTGLSETIRLLAQHASTLTAVEVRGAFEEAAKKLKEAAKILEDRKIAFEIFEEPGITAESIVAFLYLLKMLCVCVGVSLVLICLRFSWCFPFLSFLLIRIPSLRYSVTFLLDSHGFIIGLFILLSFHEIHRFFSSPCYFV